MRPGSARCATASTVADARRGEIWLLDLGELIGHEQGGQRPALVVSSDEWNGHAAIVAVLPITRTKHELPTRVEVEATDVNGLAETSCARCEDIRSVSERRLVHRVGVCDGLVMLGVGRVLRTFLEV